MTPLAEQAFAPELLLKVATCIVERHSGHALSVSMGASIESDTATGQQGEAAIDNASQPGSSEEARALEEAEPEPRLGSQPIAPMGVDIMLDTALSRLEQQTQEEGYAARYAGPGLRAKPKKVELGSNGAGKRRGESSESCFG